MIKDLVALADIRDPLWSWPLPTSYVFDEWFENTFFDLKRGANFPRFEDVLSEDKKTRIMRFAIAGYTKESIRVTAQESTLIVSCGGKEEKTKTSFAQRAWQETFHDPYGVWLFKKATVIYKDGLLTIEIPKKEYEEVELEVK